MSLLNREQIAAANEPLAGTEKVDAWGGEVGIRALSADEVRRLPALVSGDTDNIESLAKFLALVMSDDRGMRLYADNEAHLLHCLGFKTLMFVAKQAQKLNSIGEEAVEIKRKNS